MAAGILVVPACRACFTILAAGCHSLNIRAPLEEDEIHRGPEVSQGSCNTEDGVLHLARKCHTELGTENSGLVPMWVKGR